jgi:hypothetical protein
MATTLPTLTRTIDDDFVSTWYEIRPEAIDNILDATPIWNILAAAGCMVPQVGGQFITRTISYGQAEAIDVAKGDTMTPGEPELDTMAIWHFKHIATNVQRDVFSDRENSGPYKIKDYVGRRLTAARDALEQKFESNLWSPFKSVETGKIFQGLNDMVPSIANRSTGTYGGIDRPLTYDSSGVEEPLTGNVWWGSKYYDGDLTNQATTLLDDMRTLYNALHNNQSPPNLIITDLSTFQNYEAYAVDISQIIKDETTRLADLGFEVLRFKGKPMIWSKDITANNMLMLNTDFIEVVYDPQLWFDMTDWKPQAFEFGRAAQILCSLNAVTTQPRRHGRLTFA